MTQQALRELVAKWREPLPERPEYVSEAMTDEERAESDGIAKLIETQKKICAEELEALLGEQREAQGVDEPKLEEGHEHGTECQQLRGEARELHIHRHDCTTAWDFYHKHALGFLGIPSCFGCGKQEYERGVQHLELADIYLCKSCQSKLSAPPLAESVGGEKNEIVDEFYWMRRAARQIADQYRQYGCPRNEVVASLIEAEYIRHMQQGK